MKIIGQLRAILGLDKTSFDRGLNQAEKKTNAFGNVIKKIGGIMAAAFSVHAIINFSKEAMKLAATAEGVRIAFERIGNKNLLDNLRIATRGAVTDVELMRTAIQASNFQIPLNTLAALLKFASSRAIETGQSIEYLTNSIVLGIGRKSPLILDNLGISAVRLREVLKGAGVEMTTVGDVAAAVGQIASEELEKMGNVADTTATKIAKLAVAGTDLKEAWGKWLNVSPVIGEFRSYFTDLFKAWADESKTFTQKAAAILVPSSGIVWPYWGKKGKEKATWKTGQRQEEKKRAAQGINPAGAIGIQNLLSIVEPAAKEAEKSIADLRAEIEEYKTLIEATTVSDQARRNELLKQISTIEDQITKYTTLQRTVVNLEKAQGIPAPSISFNKPIMPGLQAFGATRATDSEIQKRQIDAATKSLEEQQIAVDILSSSFNALFSSSEDGFKAMFESIISGLKRLVAELLARAAILTFLNIITGGFAGALKGVFSTALGSMFPKPAKGATGGTVPSGYPNDTFPALLSSGETVLTSAQSRNFNKTIDVHVTGDIAGRAIALIGRRTEREN